MNEYESKKLQLKDQKALHHHLLCVINSETVRKECNLKGLRFSEKFSVWETPRLLSKWKTFFFQGKSDGFYLRFGRNLRHGNPTDQKNRDPEIRGIQTRNRIDFSAITQVKTFQSLYFGDLSVKGIFGKNKPSLTQCICVEIFQAFSSLC